MTTPLIGEPAPGTLDVRLTRLGPASTVAELVLVWADHCPIGRRWWGLCRDRCHVWTFDEPLCPSELAVRTRLDSLQLRPSTRDTQRVSCAQRHDLVDPDLVNERRRWLAAKAVTPTLPQATPDPVPTATAVQLDLFTIEPHSVGVTR